MESLQVKYGGFRGIAAGLQADTFIEALGVEKQKRGYGDLCVDPRSEEMVHSAKLLIKRCVV